jgi:hypothetical protein
MTTARSLERLAISITLFMLIDTAQAMSVMTNATGPYNHNCSVFFEGKPAERAAALAFAQGYAAARNMEFDSDAHVNLQVRWRELNERVVRYCTDKSNEYLYRRFVNEAAYQAIDAMRKEATATGECTVAGVFVGPHSNVSLAVRVTPNGRIIDETWPTVEAKICEQKGDWIIIEYGQKRGWIQRWFIKEKR